MPIRLFRTYIVILALGLAGYVLDAQAQSGTMAEVTIDAPSLAGNKLGDPSQEKLEIYLPPGYESSGTKRYPTIYLLHGFSTRSVLKDWAEVSQESMDEFLSHYPSKKIIIVIPNGRNAVSGSYWVDSAVGGNWETFVSSELPAYMDSHYKTIPKAASRAIVGHSMGGFGALRIGMRHSDVFSVVYAISPCCLDFDADLTSENKAWETVLKWNSMDDVRGGVVAGEFYPTALEALGVALSPDSKQPTFTDLPYVTRDGRLLPVDRIVEQWKAQMPDHMVSAYSDQLRKLRGLGVEYGLEDPFTHIPVTVNRFVNLLTGNKVPFTFESYHGDHNSGIPARMPTRILPFIADRLQFEDQFGGKPSD